MLPHRGHSGTDDDTSVSYQTKGQRRLPLYYEGGFVVLATARARVFRRLIQRELRESPAVLLLANDRMRSSEIVWRETDGRRFEYERPGEK